MSSYWMHMNPETFPEPEKFRPERWLQSEKNQDPLQHEYFVPYSALRLELYDTDEEIMKMGRGYLFSLPEMESEGVKVLVHSPA
ncbi:hypothetical protein AnigIFM49718_006239 [Aspergillus niger]|nr:hypothetical protein AnigIFM49718_006239 [Aspergillus niger]GLA18816.1 hypothetical protein AnigIFM62618_006470 [Aspergillus niger]